MAENTTTETTRKKFKGTVVSVASKDTVVVRVDRYFKHPRYGKFVKAQKKFHAQDTGNTRAVGEKIVIRECAPISKMKRFEVVSEEKAQ